jgi:recombinational DNA repair ATPase RecF
MNVSRVAVSGTVAFPERVELALPARGVVLLSGDNGSGKSSLVEAVAWATWGRGLRRRPDGRSASPWLAGLPASVEVDAETFSARVARSARGTVTVAADLGCGAVTYETSLKGYASIATVAGSIDVWRRSCVFSGADAAHFAAASDAERKDILEEMLDLGVFTAAATRAKQALSAAVAALARAREVVRIRDEDERARLADLVRAPGRKVDEPIPSGDEYAMAALAGGVPAVDAVLEADTRALAVAHDALAAESSYVCGLEATTRARIDFLDDGAARFAARLRAADRSLCEACARPITVGEQAAARAWLAAEAEIAARERAELALVRRAHVAEIQVLRAAAADVADRTRSAMDRARVVREWCRRADAAASADRLRLDATERAMAAAVAAEEARRAARASAGAAAAHRCALQAIDGTRSAVFSAALRGLSAAANGYLRRLCARYRVSLEPVSRTKSGDERDKIALLVDGAGNGEGYSGCSAGERRRIDIAVLLALGAPSACRAGTLWLDEVFLHLDAAGKAGAAELVRELARDRCVVVVEHDDEFARGLRPDRHVRVERGRLIDV